MKQLPLFDLKTDPSPTMTRVAFSHDNVSPQAARIALEQRYADLLQEADDFDRKQVSYQGNKGEVLHSWIKYREGFSAQLVEKLIKEFGIQPGDTLLEPFSGSATTLLVAQIMGINAVGIEILPVCHLAWEAKSYAYEYDLQELRALLVQIQDMEPAPAKRAFPHLAITETAFPPEHENDLMFFTDWVEQLNTSPSAKILLRLVLNSILEEISYTRKDGQFLRWDYRSEKVQGRNKTRHIQGKSLIKAMDKGDLHGVKEAILTALRAIIKDIERIQHFSSKQSQQRLLKGSALEILPTLEADQFTGVITSPPYCNRYDYTRTYALELAYLGVGEEGIRTLRQSLLSCTVEHRSKLESLRQTYQDLGKTADFERILATVQNNAVFQEINQALEIRRDRGDINNLGVLPMVEGYFIELTFIFAEIFRTCRSGAHVAFVNDNVRYGGEVIPVDLLTTELAETLGFESVKVYVLPQRKGNSSQQMGRFGREALRKSITIWRRC